MVPFSVFIFEAFVNFKYVCNNVFIRRLFNIPGDILWRRLKSCNKMKHIWFVAEFSLSVTGSKIYIQPLDRNDFWTHHPRLVRQVISLIKYPLHTSILGFKGESFCIILMYEKALFTSISNWLLRYCISPVSQRKKLQKSFLQWYY